MDGNFSSYCYHDDYEFLIFSSSFYYFISDWFYSCIPLFLIVVLNTNILYKIFSKKNLNTNGNENGKRRFSTDVKITLTIVADSIIFCILSFPFLFYILSINEIFHNTHNVISMAATATHAINFFVYAFVGEKIRRELKYLFRSNRCRCLFTKPASTRLHFEMRNVCPLKNNLSPSVPVITQQRYI